MLLITKKIYNIYAAVIFGGALAAYVQGNFLNPDFGVLNGRQIQWSQFRVNGIISTVVWIALIVVPAVIVCFKKDIMTKIMKWGSFQTDFVTHEKQERIAGVTVDVYEASETNYSEDNRIVRLQSSKGA